MRLTIIFKDEFEEHMKRQFGAFTNPQVYHVKSIHNSAYNSYSHLVDRLKKEVSNLKEKTLDLQAILEYYKHKCGELMADE